MAQTQPPAIDPVPTPAPQRGDPITFSDRVDAFIRWLTGAVLQFTLLAQNVYNNAVDAFNSASSAANSATSAATQAANAESVVGIPAWVSGTTYAKNATAISQVNFQSYRRKVAGAGTTDPANDTTNWRIIANGSNTFVPVPMVGGAIDLRLGSYFLSPTLSGDTTLSINNPPPDGSSFTAEIPVAAGTGTVAVSFAQGAAVGTSYDRPIALAKGRTHLLAGVTSNGGTRWRVSIGESFPT
jgi:hypothetical protein